MSERDLMSSNHIENHQSSARNEQSRQNPQAQTSDVSACTIRKNSIWFPQTTTHAAPPLTLVPRHARSLSGDEPTDTDPVPAFRRLDYVCYCRVESVSLSRIFEQTYALEYPFDSTFEVKIA